MARRLKIGVQLPEVEYVANWRDYLEMAREAEDAGFDSIWLGDHLLYRDATGEATGPWECLSLLSALAAVTSRVELGPLVLAAGFRNPAVTVKMAETIDEISGGRLVLGIGAGWNETEFEAFGIPFDQRYSRFAEWFEIVRRLVRDGEGSFAGEFHQIDRCQVIPRGPRPGRIPLMIGSIGERMLRLTLPHVDAWNIWFADFGNSPSRLSEHVQRVDRICRDVGRDPSDVAKTAAVLVQTGASMGRARVPSTSIPVSGSAERIARSLASYQGAGVDHLQLVLDPIDARSIASLAPVIEQVRAMDGHA